MSDAVYEEQIHETKLVPCIVCERKNPQPFLNIKDSYPASVYTNQMTPTGLRPIRLNAFLCKAHYEEMNSGGVTLV